MFPSIDAETLIIESSNQQLPCFITYRPLVTSILLRKERRCLPNRKKKYRQRKTIEARRDVIRPVSQNWFRLAFRYWWSQDPAKLGRLRYLTSIPRHLFIQFIFPYGYRAIHFHSTAWRICKEPIQRKIARTRRLSVPPGRSIFQLCRQFTSPSCFALGVQLFYAQMTWTVRSRLEIRRLKRAVEAIQRTVTLQSSRSFQDRREKNVRLYLLRAHKKYRLKSRGIIFRSVIFFSLSALLRTLTGLNQDLTRVH